ncbi:hypothetical protein EV2_014641 [Malus domestica]
MTIPTPDLQGPTTSTPAVLEFTTASLESILHHVSLDKQVQRVTESVSSLCVCQDRLQTQPTEGEDGIESQLEGLDSTLGLNHFRALESTPSNSYQRPLIYSTPLTSIPHLESVTKAPYLLLVNRFDSLNFAGNWVFALSAHGLSSNHTISSIADSIICTTTAKTPSCSTVAFYISVVDSNDDSVQNTCFRND